MRKLFLSLVGVLALLSSLYANANTQAEINHLLTFVENSGCIYDRNGSEHSPKEAREHIQKKYDYYRDDVTSAEGFIQYSATKSMISGKKYRVLCPGKEAQYSSDWLLNELKRYRQQLLVGEK